MKGNNIVFKVSVSVLSIIVLFGILAPGILEEWTGQLTSFISTSFGWYYLILVTVIALVCLYFLISPVGLIKLGKEDDKPQFNRPTWFALLFSAGMGIGLVFWGTAEPLSHYAISSPTGNEATTQGMRDALRYTFFHWGIHAWAIYGLVALVIAYFTYRKNEKALISSSLRPLFGHYVDGAFGKIIDIIAVIATVMGVSTTLGFGASQVNGGMSYLFDWPLSFWIQLIVLIIVTILFMISALTGIEKGIRILSNWNMILALILLLFVFIFGPTVAILNLYTDTIGGYIQNFFQMSFRIAPFNQEAREWIDGWTIFYWAWWISWAPFVGIFIARVSRGRSIREFVFGVLFLPSLVGFFWFATFGGTAMMNEHSGVAEISSLATEESLFAVLSQFPMALIMSILTLVLIAIFLITSADSGTFVLGMMTTNGSQTPSMKIKLTWGIMVAAIALVLLYSGGLDALQNTMISSALPFSFIMLLMMISLLKSLHIEAKELGLGRGRRQPKIKSNK
ncbi:BCCT family transporter [Alkalihalobacillus pseudalcaliphilus]|uniref:BCCT family transporter n=1 Tax=Alkalihalobacillus pseudalcaliphilus TaxID=79884 RepID=UPI00064E1497|nr:BCCT family transporter [Alkalihalobacillus pseudalcaliphilus]KMK76501.1 choline transporter [Alkalihalobacillus pseudalcaliphilus]